MKKKHTPLTNDEVRIIKISEEALYEFIYEKFIDDQDTYLDVDNLAVTDSFYMDWENRQFIFCAYKTENEKDSEIRENLNLNAVNDEDRTAEFDLIFKLMDEGVEEDNGYVTLVNAKYVDGVLTETTEKTDA